MREGSNKLENRMPMDSGHGHEGGGRNVTTATTYQTPARIRQHGVLLSSWIAPGFGFYFPPTSSLPPSAQEVSPHMRHSRPNWFGDARH